jgi:hypothetical protein
VLQQVWRIVGHCSHQQLGRVLRLQVPLQKALDLMLELRQEHFIGQPEHLDGRRVTQGVRGV